MLHNVVLCQHSFDFCNISTLCKISALAFALGLELQLMFWILFDEIINTNAFQLFHFKNLRNSSASANNFRNLLKRLIRIQTFSKAEDLRSGFFERWQSSGFENARGFATIEQNN
ncbi:hypothetical protein [Psychroserpens sp.]